MPTPTITKKADLQYKAGTSDKVYHVWIENVGANHFVKFQYGRRGSTLSSGTKCGPTDAAAALRVYESVVAEKKGKGYEPIATDKERRELIAAAKEAKKFLAEPFDPSGIPSGMSGITAHATVTTEKTKDGQKVKATWTLGTAESCQLLNPIDKAALDMFINDDQWVLQEKHDGRRMLLGSSPEGAWNRKGQMIPPPEEYCSVLQNAFDGFSFVIDGEACGEKFYAFDILWLEGLDCRSLPLHERLTNLGMLIRSGGHQDVIRQVVTAETEGEKKKLLEIIQKRNGEGVTIKDRECPYTAGRPNSFGPALKFKFVETVSCAVVKINDKRSVELGLYRTEKERKSTMLEPVGNVTIPPNHDIPEVGAVVEVQYLYAYKGGSLYQPVYRGERDDVPVDTFNELKYKPGEMPATVTLGKIEDLSAEIMAARRGATRAGKLPLFSRRVDFKLDDGRLIKLLTPDELDSLPSGTLLFDVNGKPWASGKDFLNYETRGGLTGYGLLMPDAIIEKMVDETIIDGEGRPISRIIDKRLIEGRLMEEKWQPKKAYTPSEFEERA